MAGIFFVEKFTSLCKLGDEILYDFHTLMFSRISDALYRTLGKVALLIGIVFGIAFVFRFVKQLLQDWMREKKVKKIIRYYFKEKKKSEQPQPPLA